MTLSRTPSSDGTGGIQLRFSAFPRSDTAPGAASSGYNARRVGQEGKCVTDTARRLASVRESISGSEETGNGIP